MGQPEQALTFFHKHQLPRRGFRFYVLYLATALALLCCTLAPVLRADSLSGTIKDPSGAVVAGARIEITGEKSAQPIVLTSDESGKFTAPDLSSGKYSVRVIMDGFEPLTSVVDVHGASDLQFKLILAAQQTTVVATAKNLDFANSDSTYRQLRDIGLGDTYYCENVIFNMDVGSFRLKSGTLTFLKPVNGAITGAIFAGDGHFTLKPVLRSDIREMLRRNGHETAEEDISEAIFRFTDRIYPQLSKGLAKKVDTPREVAVAFERWEKKVRQRREFPEGFTEALFQDEAMDNVDADILAALYNPKHPQFFNAYMAGSPHKDMRFFVRLRVGAIPQIDSPEEVALINFDGQGLNDGIWYAQHLVSELKANTASSLEDRRLLATRHYTIETIITRNNHLSGRATITFAPLIDGERVLKFDLLPTLRVNRVSDEKGRDLHFIQEDKKNDGSFYAILDTPASVGKEFTITIEYFGDKVLEDAGGGSYYVDARESWYPNLNGFNEKSLYDLTFKVPKSNVVVAVGKLQGETTEEGYVVSHWVTPVPVAVAGFNYGQYTKVDLPDPITHYNLSGYYLRELPDSLAQYRDGPLAAMSPGAMTKYVLDQARAQMQVCTFFFGKAPYDNLSITEQPNFNFGQSWPNLVYLPISAYIDSTQRYMLFGGINSRFTGFVQEVTPHEVAHQWFGHAVTWASYHDLWLSEGFAEFSAGLFLQQATGDKWQGDYREFWERLRHRIIDKNNFGFSPNDTGPLWLGLRLISPRTGAGYQNLVYPKGAYVLLMLKSLMYADLGTPGDKNQAFIDMMHDFMQSHRDMNASTESFKTIAEKHMTKKMDIQNNGRLDWFFDEWVYGTMVPRYQFKYEVQPVGAGNVKVRMEITQSEVDEQFAMFVPVFADFGTGMGRIGQVEMVGNSTRTVIFDLDRQPKKVALNYLRDVLER